MNSLPHPADKRITELLDLEQEEGQPLALRPETIVIMEDAGWIVDPFTALFYRDPAAQPELSLATLAGFTRLAEASELTYGAHQ